MQFRIPAVLLALGGLLPSAAGLPPSAPSGWQPVPIVSAEHLHKGDPGGEGCQRIVSLAGDAVDGRFLIFGTDVGGLWRSRDGGTRWEPCNVGYSPRGAADLAVDPRDPRRILAAGMGGRSDPWHGVWQSLDGGDTWNCRLPRLANWGPPGQLAFDPGSGGGSPGQPPFCSVAYWVCHGDVESERGLYRSRNGGTTWECAQAGPPFAGGGRVAVHPTRGWVYFAGPEGIYRSEDHGETFARLLSVPTTGLSVSRARPERVVVCGPRALMVSEDAGAHFTTRRADGLPIDGINEGNGWNQVQASPADADRLLIEHAAEGAASSWAHSPRFVSHDGGDTWTRLAYDLAGSFFPERPAGNSARSTPFLWHPTDPGTAWCDGVDYLVKSTDGGRSFAWSNAGYVGIMCFGRFNFHPETPEVLLWASQDYDSVLTLDGGRSWRALHVSGDSTYGFNYGGYAFDDAHLFAGNAAGWHDRRCLRVSGDAGKTWRDTGHASDTPGVDTACPDPADPDVAFWNNWRTADRGETWTKLDGADGVFTAARFPDGEWSLFGRRRNALVRSRDHGVTWETLALLPGVEGLMDAAADPAAGWVYLCTTDHGLYRYALKTGALEDISSHLPADQMGRHGAVTVACDPADPAVVYVGNYDWYATDAAVCRSLDGGKTWVRLTKTPGVPGLDGGHEAACVRVHPRTRELWVTTNCYGCWRYPAPEPR